MNKILYFLGAILLTILICVGAVFLRWGNIWFGNQTDYISHKIDDATNYKTLKEVEDSCRAMISSYMGTIQRP